MPERAGGRAGEVTVFQLARLLQRLDRPSLLRPRAHVLEGTTCTCVGVYARGRSLRVLWHGRTRPSGAGEAGTPRP